MKSEIEPDIVVKEARALLSAAFSTTDHDRYEQLISWVHEIIGPLVEAKYPPALWLKCSMPYSPNLSAEEFEKLYREELEKAADSGSPEAQFSLACEMDEEATIERSSLLFKKSAESGHAYAMWCHGLNLFSGRGIEKNEKEGLSFIKRSAELKFEGAIKFMADACANGTYGQEKSEEESALWWKKLSDPDLVQY